MRNEIFVLRYSDGKFVKMDDSTNPMSSGGYPYRVDQLEEATFFSSVEAAAQYAKISDWWEMEQKVYEVSFVLMKQAIDFPKVWVSCDHLCVATPESTAPTATHFLDCPIWADRLK